MRRELVAVGLLAACGKDQTTSTVSETHEVVAAPKPTTCEAGDVKDCLAKGIQYMTGSGASKDEVKGLAAFARACELDAFTCQNMGLAYLKGVGGVAKDLDMARMYDGKACDAKNGPACHVLAQIAVQGEPHDYAKALAMFQKACDLKAEDACLDLGNAYLQEKIAPRDEAKAKAALKTGCDQGDKLACESAGYLR